MRQNGCNQNLSVQKVWQGSVCFRDNLPENTTDDLCLGKADILQVDLDTTFYYFKAFK